MEFIARLIQEQTGIERTSYGMSGGISLNTVEPGATIFCSSSDF